MNYADPELRERLAADYALGTLRGPARKRFERLLADDAGLADLVEDWELRLNLLAKSAPAVEPPAHALGQDRPADRAGAGARARELAEAVVGQHRLLARRRCPGRGRRSGLGRPCRAAAAGRGAGADHGTRPAAHRHRGQSWPPVDTTTREVGALDERLARIESATHVLAETPGEIAALAGRLAGIESRLNATTLAPSHVAVLIDKYQRPMMTADLDVSEGRLALRLNIKPPRDFTGKILEVWMTQSGGTPRSLGLFPSEKSGTTTVLVLSRDIAEVAGQGGARGQPRAVRRLDNGGAVGSGPVLGRGHARRSLNGQRAGHGTGQEVRRTALTPTRVNGDGARF